MEQFEGKSQRCLLTIKIEFSFLGGLMEEIGQFQRQGIANTMFS